ncbi:MAG: HDOD domain-containing protein [bacterium]
MPAVSELELIAKINDDLPTLPTVALHLINLVLDDNTSLQDISKIVNVDQAMISKVLRIVNSAAFGLKQEINDVDHALSILGFENLKNIFLSISIFDTFGKENLEGDIFNKSKFLCHSLGVATVARRIASLLKYEHPSEAYVAGLLHDVGKIILDQIMKKEYLEYMRNLVFNPDLSIRYEEENISVNHAFIGKLALEKWNIPINIQRAVGFHHQGENGDREIDTLAAIVSVSDFICWTQGFGSFNLFSQPILNSHMEKIVNLKNLNVQLILDEMNEEIAKNSDLFIFNISDFKGFIMALQKANIELGRINSLYHHTQEKLEKHINELNILNKIIYKSREVLDPLQIIQNVIKAIHKGFNLKRVIWFSLDTEKRRIIPKAACGEFPKDLSLITEGCEMDDEVAIPICNCIKKRKILNIIYNNDDLNPNCFLLKALKTNNLFLVPISTYKITDDLFLFDNIEKQLSLDSDTIKVIDILAMNLGFTLENAATFKKTAEMAIIDPLTNIYNRRQLDISLINEVNRSLRFKQTFSLAIIDIDHFKTLNDLYGHQAGDIVLQDIAGIIKHNSRNIDIFGRYGGDEFIIIIPNASAQNALTFLERIRLIVERYGLLRQKNYPKCQITISVGVAEFEYDDTPASLFTKADKTLYLSKEKGRNKVNLYQY